MSAYECKAELGGGAAERLLLTLTRRPLSPAFSGKIGINLQQVSFRTGEIQRAMPPMLINRRIENLDPMGFQFFMTIVDLVETDAKSQLYRWPLNSPASKLPVKRPKGQRRRSDPEFDPVGAFILDRNPRHVSIESPRPRDVANRQYEIIDQ